MEDTTCGPAIILNRTETTDERGKRPMGFIWSTSASGAGTSTGKTPTGRSTTDETEEFAKDLDIVLEEIKDVLLRKNVEYGNSLLNPIRVFSKASNEEQINVRIDDKLSRIKNWTPSDSEDPAWDLLGYLLMREVFYLRKSRDDDR